MSNMAQVFITAAKIFLAIVAVVFAVGFLGAIHYMLGYAALMFVTIFTIVYVRDFHE